MILTISHLEQWQTCISIPHFNVLLYRRVVIEDIKWPCGDTNFLFECWKIFHGWAQRMSEKFFQYEKRNSISPSGHVMFYLLYKHQWNTKPFHSNSFLVWKAPWSHSNGDIFRCEGNMLLSHVKIPSFCAKAHLVFHWCLYNK